MLGIIIGLIIGIIAGLITYYLYPKPKIPDVKAQINEEALMPQIPKDKPIPIVYGTIKVSPTVLWVGGVGTEKIEKHDTTVAHRYFSAFIFGLAESISMVWECRIDNKPTKHLIDAYGHYNLIPPRDHRYLTYLAVCPLTFYKYDNNFIPYYSIYGYLQEWFENTTLLEEMDNVYKAKNDEPVHKIVDIYKNNALNYETFGSTLPFTFSQWQEGFIYKWQHYLFCQEPKTYIYERDNDGKLQKQKLLLINSELLNTNIVNKLDNDNIIEIIINKNDNRYSDLSFLATIGNDFCKIFIKYFNTSVDIDFCSFQSYISGDNLIIRIFLNNLILSTINFNDVNYIEFIFIKGKVYNSIANQVNGSLQQEVIPNITGLVKYNNNELKEYFYSTASYYRTMSSNNYNLSFPNLAYIQARRQFLGLQCILPNFSYIVTNIPAIGLETDYSLPNEFKNYLIIPRIPALNIMEEINRFDIGMQLDVNPACILYHVLTYYGNISKDDIDLDSFVNCAKQLFDEKIGMSFIIDKQQALQDIITFILNHIDGILFQDYKTGKIKMKLLRKDYDINNIIELKDDDLLDIKIKNERTFNLVRKINVTYYDGFPSVAWENPTQVVSGGSFLKRVDTITLGSQTDLVNLNDTVEIDLSGFSNRECVYKMLWNKIKKMVVIPEVIQLSISLFKYPNELEIGCVFKYNDKIYRIIQLDYSDNLSNKINIIAEEDYYNVEVYKNYYIENKVDIVYKNEMFDGAGILLPTIPNNPYYLNGSNKDDYVNINTEILSSVFVFDSSFYSDDITFYAYDYGRRTMLGQIKPSLAGFLYKIAFTKVEHPDRIDYYPHVYFISTDLLTPLKFKYLKIKGTNKDKFYKKLNDICYNTQSEYLFYFPQKGDTEYDIVFFPFSPTSPNSTYSFTQGIDTIQHQNAKPTFTIEFVDVLINGISYKLPALRIDYYSPVSDIVPDVFGNIIYSIFGNPKALNTLFNDYVVDNINDVRDISDIIFDNDPFLKADMYCILAETTNPVILHNIYEFSTTFPIYINLIASEPSSNLETLKPVILGYIASLYDENDYVWSSNPKTIASLTNTQQPKISYHKLPPITFFKISNYTKQVDNDNKIFLKIEIPLHHWYLYNKLYKSNNIISDYIANRQFSYYKHLRCKISLGYYDENTKKFDVFLEKDGDFSIIRENEFFIEYNFLLGAGDLGNLNSLLGNNTWIKFELYSTDDIYQKMPTYYNLKNITGLIYQKENDLSEGKDYKYVENFDLISYLDTLSSDDEIYYQLVDKIENFKVFH